MQPRNTAGRVLLFVFVAIGSTLLPRDAVRAQRGSGAQPATARPSSPAQAETASKPPTSAVQKAVVEFASQHHPELGQLLASLRRHDRSQFNKAVLDLNLTVERLARTQARSPERYQLDLDAWKLDSRIQLLAARMSMDDSPKLQTELKQLIEQRLEVRALQWEQERERLRARIDKLDKSIEVLRTHPTEAVERELNRLTNLSRSRARSKSNSAEATSDSEPRRLSPRPGGGEAK